MKKEIPIVFQKVTPREGSKDPLKVAYGVFLGNGKRVSLGQDLGQRTKPEDRLKLQLAVTLTKDAIWQDVIGDESYKVEQAGIKVDTTDLAMIREAARSKTLLDVGLFSTSAG